MGYLSGFLASAIALEFVLGMGLGLLFTETKFKGAPNLFLIPAIGLAVYSCTLAHGLSGDQGAMKDTTRLFLWGGAGVILCAVFVGFGRPVSVFGVILTRLGDSSYSLYLTHIFWMAGYGLFLRSYDISEQSMFLQLSFAIAVLLLCYVTSWVSYTFFERPTLRKLRLIMK